MLSSGYASVSEPTPTSDHAGVEALFAAVLAGVPLAQLGFSLRTGTWPRVEVLSPELLALSAMFVGMALIGRRERAIRLGLGLFAVSLLAGGVASAVGVGRWASWTIQSSFMWLASLLLIVELRRSRRVRLVTIVASVVLVFLVSYNVQRAGYRMWRQATKQHSVFDP
jgi:hypothetical protein